MNSTLSYNPMSSNTFGSSIQKNTDILTFSEMRPRFIEKCVESNPRQIVQVDILGDLIQLPVYALRRRNAMVHI
jgi:hypothetical protein